MEQARLPMTSPRPPVMPMLQSHLRRPGAAFRAPHPSAQLGKLELDTEPRDQPGDVEGVEVVAALRITDGVQGVAWLEASEGGDAAHENEVRTFSALMEAPNLMAATYRCGMPRLVRCRAMVGH